MPSRPVRPTTFLRAAATAVLAVGALIAGSSTAAANPRPTTMNLRIIGINDFHGNLEPPAGSSGRVFTSAGPDYVLAGGAAYLATHIKQLRAQADNNVTISAGDNIGASPLASALFHDEPTIAFLNALNLEASAAGNHEFDEGYAELQRIQWGGCHPVDGCQFTPTYTGARFPYLADNVTLDNGLPALAPFKVQFIRGIPIAYIGSTLEDLPSVVTPAAIKGLHFGDEVAAINRSSAVLTKLGIKVQILTMHQGDEATFGGPNDCNATGGEGTRISKAVSPAIDAIFTGHTHQQYICTVTDPAGQPRPMVSGLSFGRLLSVVDLSIDRRTRDVIRSATKAQNVINTRDVTPDPQVQAIVNSAVTKSAPIANRVVGTITADITRAAPATGEQPLGDVIADAQLAATTAAPASAQIAITNPGGIRTDLVYAAGQPGQVTYGEAFAVQPFSNIMQTITMTGAQLDAVLEQQWPTNGTEPKILQISSTLHYTQSLTRAIGDRVSAISVNGTPVTPTGTYRVSVNNFLAAGGDGFTAFTGGTNLVGGPIDLDAFTAYLTAHPNLAPPPATRITAG